jgi:transcription initiation factor TFIIE subunit beta
MLQHDYAFRNKAQLLTEIQRSTKKGGGLSVKTLKESWKDAPSVIEELEKEGDVLVTRTAKDGQMKMVFWNEIKPDEDGGGVRVEQGARSVWSRGDSLAHPRRQSSLTSGTAW